MTDRGARTRTRRADRHRIGAVIFFFTGMSACASGGDGKAQSSAEITSAEMFINGWAELKPTAANPNPNMNCSAHISATKTAAYGQAWSGEWSSITLTCQGFAAGDGPLACHGHVGDCASGGGGHYQFTAGGATDTSNEYHFEISPDAPASSDEDLHYPATQGANSLQSIVCHAAGGTRVLCGDFDIQEQTLGSTERTQGALVSIQDGSVVGAVDFVRETLADGSGKTTVNVDGWGLPGDVASIPCHVHTGENCATDRGKHYQQVAGGATTPPNEIHVTLKPDSSGRIPKTAASVPHAAGPTAKQLVCHDPRANNAAFLCADLR